MFNYFLCIYISDIDICQVMTKKSKKKAVKTGSRTAEGPRLITLNLGSNITQQGNNFKMTFIQYIYIYIYKF